jgi:hypothetical protein
MPIKFFTLIPYRLQDRNIQSKFKSFIPLGRSGTVEFWRPKKSFLE